MLGTNRPVDHAFRSAVLLGALLVSATGARAAESGPPARGVELAFRTGVLIPGGDAQIYTFPDPPERGPDSMSNWFGLEFPLWLDVGYRFDRWFVGAYGQYAFGIPSGYCRSCSTRAIRLGLEVQFHPADWRVVDPWLEYGLGYEWDMVDSSFFSTTFHGWELLRLGVGLDFRVAEALRLGPFIEFSLGQFQGLSSDAAKPALHYWFCIGLKLTH